MSTLTRQADGTYSLNMTAAELYAVIGKFDIGQLATDAGQGTTTPPPPPVTTPPTGFKGVFAFNNMANPTLFVDNPGVVGTVITDYWARLNPAPGVYAWDIIDNYIKPWAAAGKQIILRVSTAGWKNWQPQLNSKQGTPQWALDQGVPFVTDDDGSIKPQYWNGKFLDALHTFVQALGARYDGNVNILAIEIGVGDGGETKPDTSKASDVLSKWQTIGYTDANWWAAIQAIIQMYVGAFKQTPLALMPDASFLGGTKGYNESLVVNYAAKYSIWMQWNGLVAGATLAGSLVNVKMPLICEQLNAAGQNKRSFLQDAQTAIKLGAVAMLAFTSDLQDPANAAALKQIAAMASK
jgi:hypothetical protein